MAAVRVKIPDFMGEWPFKRQLNPNYETAKAASRDWLHTFGLFDGKPHDAFDRCDFRKSFLGWYGTPILLVILTPGSETRHAFISPSEPR